MIVFLVTNLRFLFFSKGILVDMSFLILLFSHYVLFRLSLWYARLVGESSQWQSQENLKLFETRQITWRCSFLLVEKVV